MSGSKSRCAEYVPLWDRTVTRILFMPVADASLARAMTPRGSPITCGWPKGVEGETHSSRHTCR